MATKAIEAMRARLDPGSKTLAAQEFRHTIQGSDESVSTYIRRLERTFRVAYGRDGLKAETRDALLHGQLHEGLRIDIMRGPAVSGARSYLDLCVAAKNEERRLAELRRKQQYLKAGVQPSHSGKKLPEAKASSEKQPSTLETRRCYVCGKPGHLANKCKLKRSERTNRCIRVPPLQLYENAKFDLAVVLLMHSTPNLKAYLSKLGVALSNLRLS